MRRRHRKWDKRMGGLSEKRVSRNQRRGRGWSVTLAGRNGGGRRFRTHNGAASAPSWQKKGNLVELVDPKGPRSGICSVNSN